MMACHPSNASSMQQQQPMQTIPQHPNHLPPPEMANHMSQPQTISHAPVSSDTNMTLASDANQLDMGEFPGLGMDTGNSDLNPDLAALAQSLPFSGSDMNLAGMVSSVILDVRQP